jgi:hypothetical protein
MIDDPLTIFGKPMPLRRLSSGHPVTLASLGAWGPPLSPHPRHLLLQLVPRPAERLEAGLVLKCRPIGILEVVQSVKGKKERNDRIFDLP